ncbi:hypothetical protein DRP53_08265 [candidate division WOR-3 bacterium]|uniref:Aminotransferase class I/classII large domain-containing protein n=1 Tax=candidate division WOR-3 bacterium TaxID=2052148 RepID=A0A660SF23_UNCW3|nr:MAG: hypothetical protein DRP53_08265 [candidate division WOR-3 bacterium]
MGWYILEKMERINLDTITGINTSLRLLKDPVNFAMGDIRPTASEDESFRDFINKALIRSMTYTPVLGDPSVREGIARFVNKRDGLNLRRGNVAITCGGIQAIFAILNLQRPGVVILANPSWSAYDFPIRANGMEALRVDLTDPDLVLKSITGDTVAIIINNPENPTGRIYERKGLISLIDRIVQSRPDIWIIIDEVYIDLVYEGRLESMAGLIGEYEKLIVINSLSKSCAMTGWRTGYVLGGEELIRRLRAPIRASTTCVPRISQLAMSYVIENFDRYNDRVREMLKRRRDLLTSILSGITSVDFRLPEAGIYLWINLEKTGRTGDEVMRDLFHKKEVGVVPGRFFGSAGERFIRISFGYEDEERIKVGAERIAEYLSGG